MERHGAQFERKTRHQEHQAERKRQVADLARTDRVGDIAQVEAAGGAVDHGHAIEHEARGKRAKHEIFHRGFGRALMIAAQCNHRVERQRHQLKAQVDRKEVARRNHHHLAKQRKEHEDVEFASSQHVAALDVLPTVDQRDGNGDVGRHFQHQRKRIRHEHAEECFAEHAACPLKEREDEQHRERRKRKPVGQGAPAAAPECVRQQNEHAHRQEEDLRGSQDKIKLGLHHGEAYSLEMDTWCNRAWTEVCMTSVKGLG